MKYILLLAFIASSSLSFGQISEDKLKDIITEKLLRWETVLGLSQTKSDKLQTIFEEREQAMFNLINSVEGNMSVKLKEIDAETNEKIKNLFTGREYQMYSTISEQEKMSQYDYLSEIIGGYAEDEELAKEIFNYQMTNILPRLRVARLQLDAYIHPEDHDVIEGLRSELFQTLDECLINCSVDRDSTQSETILLNQLLSNAISEQLDDEASSLNTLFKLTKQYETAIKNIYKTLEEDNKTWTADLATIQKHHIMPTHLESFKELTNVASYISLEHMKKDAFFLLADGNNTQSLMKVLRIGNHFMPYVGM